MTNRNTQDKSDLFERELFNPMRGHELSMLEQHIGHLLVTEATSERPLRNADIQSRLLERGIRATERTVKDVIRSLRHDHHFPIIARREKPAGYFWCTRVEEMQSYIAVFRAQAMDELTTLGKIVRANYPELDGQLTIESEVKSGNDLEH